MPRQPGDAPPRPQEGGCATRKSGNARGTSLENRRRRRECELENCLIVAGPPPTLGRPEPTDNSSHFATLHQTSHHAGYVPSCCASGTYAGAVAWQAACRTRALRKQTPKKRQQDIQTTQHDRDFLQESRDNRSKTMDSRGVVTGPLFCEPAGAKLGSKPIVQPGCLYAPLRSHGDRVSIVSRVKTGPKVS